VGILFDVIVMFPDQRRINEVLVTSTVRNVHEVAEELRSLLEAKRPIQYVDTLEVSKSHLPANHPIQSDHDSFLQ